MWSTSIATLAISAAAMNGAGGRIPLSAATARIAIRQVARWAGSSTSP
jgi:hypothetical protein